MPKPESSAQRCDKREPQTNSANIYSGEFSHVTLWNTLSLSLQPCRASLSSALRTSRRRPSLWSGLRPPSSMRRTTSPSAVRYDPVDPEKLLMWSAAVLSLCLNFFSRLARTPGHSASWTSGGSDVFSPHPWALSKPAKVNKVQRKECPNLYLMLSMNAVTH